jgi:hypothetical protein
LQHLASYVSCHNAMAYDKTKGLHQIYVSLLVLSE